MRCDHDERWLSAYLDGELTAPQLAALEAHLSGCEGCARGLDELRGNVALLRALPMEEPPPGLRPQILFALQATRPSPWAWLTASKAALGAWRLALGGTRREPSRSVPSAKRQAPSAAFGLATVGAAAVLVALMVMSRPAALRRTPSPASDVSAPRSAPSAHPDAAVIPHPAVTTFANLRPSLASSRLSAPKPLTVIRSVARPLTEPGARKVRHALIAQAHPRPADQRSVRVGQSPSARGRANPTAAPSRPRSTTNARPELPPMDQTSPPPISPAASDTGPDEPPTLMASMPMETSEGAGSEMPSRDDSLASLRRRLAEQRREAPSVPIDTSRHNARFAPLPVRIPF